MKKLVAIVMLLFSMSAVADAQIDAPKMRDYAAENEQEAWNILSGMSDQERLNMAQIYFLNLYQQHCTTRDGRLFMLDIRYSDTGTSSVVCSEQLLAQVRMDQNHIRVRFPNDMQWTVQSHVQELCMFQPDLCTLQK